MTHHAPVTRPTPATRRTRILLGISGGIAAYKTPELVRQLRARSAEVRVVMTRAAESFVAPLSLQAVSGHAVRATLWDPEAEAGMDHIALARWADRVLIAPATAHLMARLAQGLADDLLTTLLLATEAPVWIAPAMNQAMWRHPATQANATLLAARGCRLLGPAEGEQACGEIGPGRMLEPAALAEAVLAESNVAESVLEAPVPAGHDSSYEVAGHPSEPSFRGLPILLTAGPTHEPIDPVRYIGNRSSGKMGYALAAALAARGARVTLISGPTALDCPPGVERVNVESAAEMFAAVQAQVAECRLFIGTAAVADYRPKQSAAQKLKKNASDMTLNLERTADILAWVAALPDAERPFVVGFAAETQDVEAYARGKLEAKRLDMIAANQVGAAQGGFGADENALLVLWPGGRESLPMRPKPELASALADLIARQLGETARR